MKKITCAVICCLFMLSTVLTAETKNRFESGIKCAVPTLKNAFQYSSAVFVGEVLSVEKNGDEKIFEFLVKKYWKGVKDKKVKVRVYETPRYQAWFEVGKSYLVFAGRDENGNLRDERCSATKLSSQASKDIKQLGRAKTPR